MYQAECEQLLSEVARLSDEKERLVDAIEYERTEWQRQHKVRGQASSMPLISYQDDMARKLFYLKLVSMCPHDCAQADVETLRQQQAAAQSEMDRTRSEVEGMVLQQRTRAQELEQWAAAEEARLRQALQQVDEEQDR